MVDMKTFVYLINVYQLQPLNPNPNSQWAAYFKDNEMLLQIDKDCRYMTTYTINHTHTLIG